MRKGFQRILPQYLDAPDGTSTPADASHQVTVANGDTFPMTHGQVLISAITSCTNTSNPSVMIAAGLVAKKAVERGLSSKPWVKTMLAPGSKVVTDYYDKVGLTPYLEKMGFHTVGYGCTTCIGNSGALKPEISDAVHTHNLAAAAVLSGNRNFEARINPDIKMNFLASPPLVVAYAIAGTIDIDLDLHPTPVVLRGHDGRADPPGATSRVRGCSRSWATRSRPTTSRPPAASRPTARRGSTSLRTGCAVGDFNSYGSRRGNHEVMVRGTFANIRLRNAMVPGVEGGFTRDLLADGAVVSIHAASERARAAGVPLVVLAGAEYGSGSSRDWAAKGTAMLGVRAVIARSFERIHRSNLIGMGVLPLEFPTVRTRRRSGSPVTSRSTSAGSQGSRPRCPTTVACPPCVPTGPTVAFDARVRIDTPGEAEYFRHGGILPYVLRSLRDA
jgi:aconitate hydratase